MNRRWAPNFDRCPCVCVHVLSFEYELFIRFDFIYSGAHNEKKKTTNERQHATKHVSTGKDTISLWMQSCVIAHERRTHDRQINEGGDENDGNIKWISHNLVVVVINIPWKKFCILHHSPHCIPCPQILIQWQPKYVLYTNTCVNQDGRKNR